MFEFDREPGVLDFLVKDFLAADRLGFILYFLQSSIPHAEDEVQIG